MSLVCILVITHTKQSDSVAQCPHCRRIFTGKCCKNNMKQHIEAYHTAKPIDQWEQCPVCLKRFITHKMFLNHMGQTHGIFKRPRNWRVYMSPFFNPGAALLNPPPGTPAVPPR